MLNSRNTGIMNSQIKLTKLEDVSRFGGEAPPVYHDGRTLLDGLPLEGVEVDADFDRLVQSLIMNAIERQEVKVVFQPIIRSFDDGLSVSHFETLSRWGNEVTGMVAPPIVIKMAEEMGVIDALTELLFRRALYDFNKMPSPANLAFNTSPKQLKQANFVQDLMSWMTEAKFDPGRLLIEISEDAVASDIDQVANVICLLQRVGVHVALDDFGAGSTSLAFLGRIPVDVIKIDKALVQGARTSLTQREILFSLGQMCRRLEITGVAEGVETQEDFDIAKACGYSHFQGFHFSKPHPIEVFDVAYFSKGDFRENGNMRHRSSFLEGPGH